MKITTKINLLTTLWMVFVLAIINILVYFLFMTTTINIEKNNLYNKSDEIIKELQLIDPTTIESKLKEFLSDNSFVRIVDKNNQVVMEVTNDKKLSGKIKASYTSKKVSKNQIISVKSGEEQVLVARIPFQQEQISESLEIGERLKGLETRKEILSWILIFGTFLAALLSLFGGKWLANIIMKPISNIIHTMSEIEKSGVPQKITNQNHTKDELQTMITTFNQMIDRLKENIEKQEQFISDASHELKTPLTVIKTYAGVLRRQGFENKDVAKEAIKAIESETNRMQKMTDTFLDLATLENRNVVDLSNFDLVSLCQEMINQMKEVHRREIDLVTNDSSIHILADELKVKQVMIILLDNAIKYSTNKIECSIAKDQNDVIISVKDYGIGIPQNEIENIFERFYRVDKARSRETGGTGLGLHIAKSIMKLHHGDICV